MIHTFSAPVVDFFCFSRRDLRWGGKKFVIFNIATLLYVTAIHKITQTSFQYFVQLGLKHGKRNSTNSKKGTQMHLALVSFCSGIQKIKKIKKLAFTSVMLAAVRVVPHLLQLSSCYLYQPLRLLKKSRKKC